MRFRNLKDKEEIINESNYVIKDAKKYIGKWREVFNNDNPIYIEIGMGKGKFIKENAIKYPNINFIGIERQDNALARAIKNIDIDISNLKLLSMDALELDEVFDREIDRIYLNFSDPWPKKRQAKRRLTSEVFLEKYDKIFKNEKSIYLRTDNEGLFTYSIESLSNYGYKLSSVYLDFHRDCEKFDEVITTEYEDKFANNGDRIYSLIGRK